MGQCELLDSVDDAIDFSFHRVECHTMDVLEHAEALPLWSQDYTQLSNGTFIGAISSIHQNGIQIFSEKMNRAVDQIANAPYDCYVIGLPVAIEGDATWGLLPVKPGSLITLGKNAELYFRTSSSSEIIAAVIPMQRLRNFAHAMAWESFEDAIKSIKPVESLDPDIAGRLLKTLKFGLQHLPEYNKNTDWIEFEEDLLSCCMHALMHASTNTHPYFDHRIPRYIVNRVRELTLANDGFQLSIDELCESLRIKRRTLNQAFARVLGVTPLTYMRHLKLHKVRMDLMYGEGKVASISSVAAKRGFIHMSLFSRYYRELFGECPMETLHRSKETCAGQAMRVGCRNF